MPAFFVHRLVTARFGEYRDPAFHAGKIRRDESKCFQCGACTGICPVGALAVHRPDMAVVFSPEKCTGCGLCVVGCPVRAMEVSFDEIVEEAVV